MILSAISGAATLIIAFRPGRPIAGAVHHVRGLEAQQPSHLDFDAGVAIRSSHTPGSARVLANAVRDIRPFDHRVERLFGRRQWCACNGEFVRAEPSLRNLKARGLAQQHVRGRDAHSSSAIPYDVRRIVLPNTGK